MKRYIADTVHHEYYDLDTNCAGVTLKCLSHLFDYEVMDQAFNASLGMHGAGGYRAQCGLVEGGLMFLSMYLTAQGWDRAAVIQACRQYGEAFDGNFGALTCRELRPQGFAEGLTNRAILFT